MLRAFPRRRLARHHLGPLRPAAAAAARQLRAAGVAAGDRVLICSENRPEYPIAETALMAIRAVPVPAYTTNTVDDHAHILRDSGARRRHRLLRRAGREARGRRRGLDLLVVMDGADAADGPPRILPWPDLVAGDDAARTTSRPRRR